MSSSGLVSSSIEISPEGRLSVMIFLTLGESGSLEVGVTNPEGVYNTEDSVSGSEISGSLDNSPEGEIFSVISETEIGS